MWVLNLVWGLLIDFVDGFPFCITQVNATPKCVTILCYKYSTYKICVQLNQFHMVIASILEWVNLPSNFKLITYYYLCPYWHCVFYYILTFKIVMSIFKL